MEARSASYKSRNMPHHQHTQATTSHIHVILYRKEQPALDQYFQALHDSDLRIHNWQELFVPKAGHVPAPLTQFSHTSIHFKQLKRANTVISVELVPKGSQSARLENKLCGAHAAKNGPMTSIDLHAHNLWRFTPQISNNYSGTTPIMLYLCKPKQATRR